MMPTLAGMLRPVMLFLHLTSVVVWVGGMFFAYFCLRPAAAQLLEPPHRLPLWLGTFGRFFPLVTVAVALILLSGLTMLLRTGLAAAPLGWHVMLALGLVMAAVFAYVYIGLYPRLRRHCEAAAWSAAAAALNGIRRLVGLNLVLAACAIAAAVSSR